MQLTTDHLYFTIYLIPLTTYHLLLTTYYLLCTTYHLPPTNYHLPLTTYHLPLWIIHHLSFNIWFLSIPRERFDDLDNNKSYAKHALLQKFKFTYSLGMSVLHDILWCSCLVPGLFRLALFSFHNRFAPTQQG